MSKAILNVNDVEGARMSLTVYDGTDTTQVTTSSDHTQVSYGIKKI